MRAYWLLLFFRALYGARAATLGAEATGVPPGGTKSQHGSELEAGAFQVTLELTAAPADTLLQPTSDIEPQSPAVPAPCSHTVFLTILVLHHYVWDDLLHSRRRLMCFLLAIATSRARASALTDTRAHTHLQEEKKRQR